MFVDLSHFSLHYKLPFLILGIDILKSIHFKVREHSRLPLTCPQLFYPPLRIHFSQNLFLKEVDLFCDLQEGRKLLLNKEEFCSHSFMIFPHKGGLESPPYLHYAVLIQKDLQHFVIFSDDSKYLTTPTDPFAFFLYGRSS